MFLEHQKQATQQIALLQERVQSLEDAEDMAIDAVREIRDGVIPRVEQHHESLEALAAAINRNPYCLNFRDCLEGSKTSGIVSDDVNILIDLYGGRGTFDVQDGKRGYTVLHPRPLNCPRTRVCSENLMALTAVLRLFKTARRSPRPSIRPSSWFRRSLNCRHWNSTWSTVCRLSPQLHFGSVMSGTLRLKRKSLRPIFSVRSWTKIALCRLLRSS
ncbi:hypothetical protein F4824DRAFT_154866 [Ustulina deusta]|nr:hypothetical protein F4824DRAFT_428791 [Ustulina deusta]KAI3335358.1 hypothetical protein F4824DRAFT_154866 [Ustulina deusta]